MNPADKNKPLSLRKLDSTVLLERYGSSASGRACLRQDTARASPSDVEHGAAREAPVGLDVSIRFDRISVLVVLVVAVLASMALPFFIDSSGIPVGSFDPSTMDTRRQEELIARYNSYTGSVAAILGPPIEMFIPVAVRLVLMRVMAASLLSTEIGWKVDALTLAATTAVSFLVTNSLSALNVQPGRPDVQPWISTDDLTFVPEFSRSDTAARSSNLTQTFSERSPRNPITNTVLRNLVLPRVPAAKPACTSGGSLLETVPDVILEYGFAQRDWQSRLLQEAIEPKQLRVIVNSTKTSVQQTPNASDLPMDASLAADIFVHSMFLSQRFFGWSQGFDFADLLAIRARYPNEISDSAAHVFNLIPPASPARDEMAQREWFLRESATTLTRKLNNSLYVSRSDVAMEFSHVEISPTMRFDAVTLEIEVDPSLVTDRRGTDNSTRYTRIRTADQCGPWPMSCMMKKPDIGIHGDPTGQVQVFGACVNSNGTEEVAFKYTAFDLAGLQFGLDCPNASNTSLMVVSIGKRFVADSVILNESANASGVFEDPYFALATNLRRIYTFTVGKLSWELSYLATEYSATCSLDAGSCQGLRFSLTPTVADSSQQQELIIGAEALPTKLLSPLELLRFPRFVPLVQLRESPMCSGKVCGKNSSLAADPLLPHNTGKVEWARPSDPSDCQPETETHYQLVLDNHRYIEHGLQTAYTAATFFLLQNAVVKDVIDIGGNVKSLNFQHNKQRVTLWASVPPLSALLTLCGCALLALGLGGVMWWARATTKTAAGALGEVTTPHVVARVMLDSVHFPPMFLHRRVIGASDDGADGDDNNTITVEGYVIDGLVLRPPPCNPDSSKTSDSVVSNAQAA